MNKILTFIFCLIFLSSCTKDYWDDFEWGFDYLKRKKEIEVVEESPFENFGILPPKFKENIKGVFPYEDEDRDSIPITENENNQIN